LNENWPITMIFGILITQTVGGQKIVSFSHLACFLQQSYVGKLSNQCTLFCSRKMAVYNDVSSSIVPVLAQFDLLSMGEGGGEEGREEFDLLSPRASNSLQHTKDWTCQVTINLSQSHM